jgi:hypothetical protein
MYRGILAFMLLAVAGSVSAQQQVYKCVVPGKPVSYQSQPCPGQAVRAWDAVPDADNPYLRARLADMDREVRQRRAAQRPYTASTGGGRAIGASIPSRTVSSSGACESARAQRDAVYRAAGHRRSFAVSRTMDDAVYNACK